MSGKILVLEDEDAIRELIVINLKRAGYDVVSASNANEAIKLFTLDSLSFDVVLLDIMMEGNLNGMDVLRHIRSITSICGIIMLSAKGQEIDKVLGLNEGADDYMTKPFSSTELIARVDSVCRRAKLSKNKDDAPITEQITLGNYRLNLMSRSIYKNEKLIEVTHIEYQILEYLMLQPNQEVSRSAILRKVWGAEEYSDDKIVDVNIRRLRVKLEDNPSEPKHLITIWGVGYKWQI